MFFLSLFLFKGYLNNLLLKELPQFFKKILQRAAEVAQGHTTGSLCIESPSSVSIIVTAPFGHHELLIRPKKILFVCPPVEKLKFRVGQSIFHFILIFFFFTLSNLSRMIKGRLTKDFIANTKQCRASSMIVGSYLDEICQT